MIPLTLAQIAEITGGELRGDPAAVVTGEVVIDSRRAGPGGLFAAVAGERADGHDFAPDAVAAGAVAVLATRPVPVPSVLLNPEWVTPTNMNSTVIADKFVPASQLCAGKYAAACTAAGIH